MSTAFTPNKRGGLVQSKGVRAPELTKSDLSRVLPRQNSTGSSRGTQSVGVGGTKIDGANNRITVGDSIILDGNASEITVGDTITISGDNSQINVGDSIVISGEDDSISITTDTDTVLALGAIPGGGVGMSITDEDDNVIFKMDGQTWYWYDPDTGLNVLQVGLLPDGSYGIAGANEGYNVSQGF